MRPPAHLIGVVWSHGIALGSPVVPDEKRTLIASWGSRVTLARRSSAAEEVLEGRVARPEGGPLPFTGRRRDDHGSPR